MPQRDTIVRSGKSVLAGSSARRTSLRPVSVIACRMSRSIKAVERETGQAPHFRTSVCEINRTERLKERARPVDSL